MPGTSTYVYITIIEEKDAMNLKDSKGGIYGRIPGRKRKEEKI